MLYDNSSIDAVMALERQRTESYIEVPKKLVYICSDCGGEIYDGDDCLLCDNGAYCRRCVMQMESDDVVELLGYKICPACDAEA